MLRLIRPLTTGPDPGLDEPSSGRQGDVLRPLADKAINGDAAAACTLLVAVGPTVLGVVRRVLGASHPELEDVCQECCIGLLSALPSFRAECTVLHYACRVALLTALAARRRMRRNEGALQEASVESEDFVGDQPSAAELLDAHRRRLRLRKLLDELPLSHAEVLALHVMLGYTVQETGAIVGVPINTVRGRLRRGLAALRELLSADGNFAEMIGGHHE